MKKIIPLVSSIISCIWLGSCGNSSVETSSQPTITPSQQTPSQTGFASVKGVQTQSSVSPEPEKKLQKRRVFPQRQARETPKIGIVKNLVNGDLLCYVTLVDKIGVEHHVGATFDICAEQEKYLNHKVRAFYQIEPVSDCESNEPCGKTKQESIITRMRVLDKKNVAQSSKSIQRSVVASPQPDRKNSQTLTNGEWTITVGNYDSWTGVNGTGDFTYSACNSQGTCLKLTKGKVFCRDGKCSIDWTNKNYSYILESNITEAANSSQQENSSSTLKVFQGSRVVLTVGDLKPVPSN